MFDNILLAVDGSKHAMHTAEVAGEFARKIKSANLRIVIVYEPVPSFLGEPNLQQAINARLASAEAILEKTMKKVGKISGKIHTEVLEGTPAEAIIKVAQTRENDLIIMGSRGLGQLSGLVLGSQSQKVVSLAPCPVMIVR